MTILKRIVGYLPADKGIIKFSILILLTEFVRGAYLNYTPLYINNVLEYKKEIIGAVECAFFLMETLTMIGLGWLLDRFNNRIILVSGLLISFISLLLLKFVYSPMFLILGGGMFGLGFAPVWLMILGYLTSFSEEKRAAGMGVIYAAWLVGLGLGSVTANFIAFRSYSLALYVMIALWAVCIAISLFIKEGIKNIRKKEKENVSKSFIDILKEFANAKYLVPGMILQTFSVSILAPIVLIYLTDPKFVGLNLQQNGLTLAAIGGITVIFLTTFGRIAKSVGVEKLFIYGMLLASLGVFGIGNIATFVSVIIFGLMFAISYSAVLPAWNAILANNIRQDNKGLMWGGFSTIEGIGRAAGALIGGKIASDISMQFTFNLSATILLALAIFYFILNRKKMLRPNKI